jgi:hypothetical protein
MNIPVSIWKAKLKREKMAETCRYVSTSAAKQAPIWDKAAAESPMAASPRARPLSVRVERVKPNRRRERSVVL